MPFVSKAQQRFLFARKPEVAKRFAKKTKSFKRLPERAGSAFETAVKRRLKKSRQGKR